MRRLRTMCRARPVNGRRHGCVGVVRPITALWEKQVMASDDALAEGQGQGRKRWFGGRGSASETPTQERESNMAPTEPGIEESVTTERTTSRSSRKRTRFGWNRRPSERSRFRPRFPRPLPETLASLRARGRRAIRRRGRSPADHLDRESKGWRRQDDDRRESRRGARRARLPGAGHRPRSAGQCHDRAWGSATEMSRARSTTSS